MRGLRERLSVPSGLRSSTNHYAGRCEHHPQAVERVCAIPASSSTSCGGQKPGFPARQTSTKALPTPGQQLTDSIGVRVINLLRDAVDPIASRLRQEFEINTRARLTSGGSWPPRLGYSSVHLIARLKPNQVSPGLQPLRNAGLRFRFDQSSSTRGRKSSMNVYKSGIKYSDAVKRRFAALAGSLELLDNEFLSLTGTQRSDRRTSDIYRAKGSSAALDVARLLGYLEAVRPNGRSWRQPRRRRTIWSRLDTSCVEALRSAGLGTAALETVFQAPRFRYAVRSFAAARNRASRSIHLAVVVLAVAIKDARMINGIPGDHVRPAIALMVQKRAQGSLLHPRPILAHGKQHLDRTANWQRQDPTLSMAKPLKMTRRSRHRGRTLSFCAGEPCHASGSNHGVP